MKILAGILLLIQMASLIFFLIAIVSIVFHYFNVIGNNDILALITFVSGMVVSIMILNEAMDYMFEKYFKKEK